jgi:hypothetical protein
MQTTFQDPSRTLQLLDELGQAGFTDEAFAVVHHHKPPMTIADHRAYCTMLAEDGDYFKLNSNMLVQKRLDMILTMYRSAGFSSGASPVFYHLAQASLSEVPHDTRPRSEQYTG